MQSLRAFLVILQILFVICLLIIWLASESIQESKNLWILFFYSFPSEFLISTVAPHEPVLIYFGKFYSPLIVAGVAVASTVMTELINYSTIRFITDFIPLEKIQKKKILVKILSLFNQAPFLALVVAGILPFPFYPFRFLVVFTRYPLWQYLAAVLLARLPRFYVLALIGKTFRIPDYCIIAIIILFIFFLNFPFIKNLWKSKCPRTLKALL